MKKTTSRKESASKTKRKTKKVVEPRSPEPSTLGGGVAVRRPQRPRRGTGSAAAGQSGDLQGLSRRPGAASESVEELLEEGQYYEADVVSGIENAPGPEQGEVRTRQVPEDDVPEEYEDNER
jgi:hypothetical protein